MKHIGLFEGIGGFSLAARWIGWQTVAYCEINPICRTVLNYHFPDAEPFNDIITSDFSKYKNAVQIVTGGFPCQPYSLAGKRKGTEDERHLWPSMLKAIRTIQPNWVVAENVGGLVSWNGGLVFNEVQTDLETEGYEVQPFILPACAKDAPHRRDRLWIVAYRNHGQCEQPSDTLQTRRDAINHVFNNAANASSNRWDGERKEFEIKNGKEGCEQYRELGGGFEGLCCTTDATDTEFKRFQVTQKSKQQKQLLNAERNYTQDATDTKSERLQGEYNNAKSPGGIQYESTKCNSKTFTDTYSGRQSGKKYRETKSGRLTEESLLGNWENFPTQSPICGGDDGLPTRLDGITFSKWRNESIKAYGNAIVPQVALEIYKAIDAMIKLGY